MRPTRSSPANAKAPHAPAEILGYRFANAGLLAEALTTPSARMQRPDLADNQRLEFLGDAVLGFLSAERLYGEFPGETEGALTVRRTHMVSTTALCKAAADHGLVPLLVRNRRATPLPPNSKTIADAVEAIFGAAYLDGGFAAVRQIFDALGLGAHAGEGEWSANPKGELQVRAQALHPPRRPEYTLLASRGKAHEPVFTIRVAVEGLGEAQAEAGTRKEAEMRAAQLLLNTLNQGERP